MSLRYFIIDDDMGSRRMLEQIIEDDDMGEITGTAESGEAAIPQILASRPDIVLIDFLMPELDGIETMERLQKQGFDGQFIMISQVINKEMVGEAYEKGVGFFIHKPINRTEVHSILQKTAEQIQLKRSLMAIKLSLAGIESAPSPARKMSPKEQILSILSDMGIVGEPGCNDMVSMIEYLLDQKISSSQFPPLKDLYEAVAGKSKDVKKESKAIEQRIRRTVLTALNNLASLGAMDYANPKFEYYAPRFFDFQDVRLRMRELEEEEEATKAKLNIKKFLQVLYLETLEKMAHR